MLGKTMKLTELKVKSLKPAEKVYRVSDGANFYIEVTPAGGKHYWRYVFTKPGGGKTMRSLGAYPVVTLKRAREKALALAREIEAGTLGSKEADKPPTFNDLAADWARAHLGSYSIKEAVRKQFLLDNYILPELGPLPADSIKAGFILEKVLRPLETRGILETAHKVKSQISMICDHAIASGKAERNPARDLSRALKPAKTEHFPAITDPAKVGGLLRAIDGFEGKPAVEGALKLLPLVFVRPGELRSARWEEIDLEGATWRIPAGRMKMKAPHIVPLSRQAAEVLTWLKGLTGGGPLVFPGVKSSAQPISDTTINAALRRLGYSSKEITAHGFRAMASTLLNELGFSSDWIGRQLGHSERNGVRAACNHADCLPERRQMMQKWADHLDRLRMGKATPPAAPNTV
jgi:integrase